MNKKGWLSQAGDTIIFDMDGTLIDSVGVWNDVDAALIKELGGPEEDPSFTQPIVTEARRCFLCL